MGDQEKKTVLKDLIYFDEDKASSLLSQIEGGLPQELQEGTEDTEDKRSIKRGNLKIISGEFGGIETEKLSRMQRKILHHDLLDRVETFLTRKALILDINNAVEYAELDDHVIRKLLTDVDYIRAEGKCSINEFERLQRIMRDFQWLVEFINKCNEHTIKRSEAYTELNNQIEDQRKGLKSIKDRNERARQKKLIDEQERRIKELVESLYDKVDAPDEWLLNGFSKWIDIFNPGQILLRLIPFDKYQDFEIVSNLKREYFLETDINHVTFSYGQNPDVKLTLMGLVTSRPPLEQGELNLRDVHEEADTQHNRLRQFENAFLNMFDSMEGIAAFGRFVTFPNITVYPIAFYRQINTQIIPEA